MQSYQAALAVKTSGQCANAADDLLHDGVITVLPLGLQHLDAGGDEHAVVPPDGEQIVRVLPDSLRVLAFDAARSAGHVPGAWRADAATIPPR